MERHPSLSAAGSVPRGSRGQKVTVEEVKKVKKVKRRTKKFQARHREVTTLPEAGKECGGGTVLMHSKAGRGVLDHGRQSCCRPRIRQA